MRLLSFYLPLLCLVFYSCSVSKQEQTPQSCVSLAQNKLFEQAKLCFENQQTALTNSEKLAYAGTLTELGETEKALVVFEELSEEEPTKPIYPFYIAKISHEQGKLKKAKEQYLRFLDLGSSNPHWKKSAEAFLRNYDVLVKAQSTKIDFDQLIKLPPSINTDKLEFGPSLTLDGQRMVFTRNVGGQEDLYYSEKNDSGEWMDATLIEELYTPANEGAHCLSADGRVLIFTRCIKKEGFGSCDLYWSLYDGLSWSKPQNMGEHINSEYWESQPAISADGKYLFFSSNRPQGKGGRDIWVSILREGEGWGAAFNAGDQINTKGNEEAPFLHADQRTLYFASDFWPGHGGLDIFVTRNKGKSRWSEPQNLGPLINNDKDNYGFYVDWSGESAFFHEYEFTREGVNTSDIYEIKMMPEFRPNPTSYLDIVVRRVKDSMVMANAEIKLRDTKSGKLIYESTTDRTGYAICALQSKSKQVSIEVSKEGYIFYSDYFDLRPLIETAHAYKIDVSLERLPAHGEEVKTVILNNVFFESGQAVVLPESMTELQKLTELLQANPHFQVQINGHTDDVGSKTDNLKLSQDRAESVKKKLIELGVDHNRIEAIGYGEAKPIADNNTEEGKLQNRRTEFLIVSK